MCVHVCVCVCVTVQVLEHLLLVLDNCCRYNPPTNDFHTLAMHVEQASGALCSLALFSHTRQTTTQNDSTSDARVCVCVCSGPVEEG